MSQRRSYVFAADGTVIFDVLGADPDGETIEDEDLDEGDGTDGEDEGEDEGEEDENSEETVESLKTALAEMTEKHDRVFRRMQRADRAKTLANQKLKDLESGDGAKLLAAANAKIAELETKLSSAGGQDKSSIVREEFRDTAGFSWHNPKLAFSLLELDEVDVDEKTGKVDSASLKDAMKDLAKAHPYLVKTEEKKPENDDEDTDKPEPTASGSRTAGKRRKTVDEKALARKYAVLSSRS